MIRKIMQNNKVKIIWINVPIMKILTELFILMRVNYDRERERAKELSVID